VSEDGVFNDEDPMFGQPAFQPRCAADSSCDGKFYSFNVGGEAKPLMILGKEAKLTSTVGDVTTELSFDAGTNWRGYVFVPSGLWRKLNPDEYTAASVMAVTAGPSMSVTLGGKGTTAGETPFTIAEQELVNLSYDIPGAISFQFGAGVDASLTGKVKTSKPLTAPLTAHAYYTAGVLSTFNTAASDGFDFSFKSYPDIENGFTTVESVTFAPEVVPYVSAKVGMFTPSIPILGQFSVFDAGAKFENPLGANLTYKTKPGPEEKSFSVELYSEGNLDFGVHVLPFLTNELSYDDKLELYKVSGQFT
jgi:hypothetical protein